MTEGCNFYKTSRTTVLHPSEMAFLDALPSPTSRQGPSFGLCRNGMNQFCDKPTDGQRSGFNLPLQSQYPKVINPLCKAKRLTYPQTEDLDNPVKIHNFQPRPGKPSMVKWSHTEGVFWDLSTKFFEWSVQNIAAMFCLDWQQKNMVKAFHWKVPFLSNIFKSVTHCWQWCFRYNIQKFDTSC